MGGGWITTPALYALGVPMNVAVGTGLAQMVGQSVVSTLWHSKFGNVSVRVATMMIPGTQLRALFGAALVAATASLIVKSFLNMPQLATVLILGIAGLMAAIIIGLLVRGLIRSGHSQQQEAARRE